MGGANTGYFQLPKKFMHKGLTPVGWTLSNMVILRKSHFKVSYVSELFAGMRVSVRVYLETRNGHGYQTS